MASKKSSKVRVNKSAWIRSQPSDKPASELVLAAKKAGISISAGLVYAIRSADKGKGSGKTKVRKASTPSKASAGGLEDAIRAIVREEIKTYFTER